MGKLLVIAGLVLVAVGVVWTLGERIGLGRLPGDVLIERAGTRIYIPITTSLLISAVLSLVLWVLSRW